MRFNVVRRLNKYFQNNRDCESESLSLSVAVITFGGRQVDVIWVSPSQTTDLWKGFAAHDAGSIHGRWSQTKGCIAYLLNAGEFFLRSLSIDYPLVHS